MKLLLKRPLKLLAISFIAGNVQLYTFAAQAVTIRNLDSVAQTITVSDSGQEEVVSILPNKRYRTVGPFVTIQHEGKTFRTRGTNYQYIILNGTMHLQSRGQRSRR